jgi:hypothetical protein
VWLILIIAEVVSSGTKIGKKDLGDKIEEI